MGICWCDERNKPLNKCYNGRDNSDNENKNPGFQYLTDIDDLELNQDSIYSNIKESTDPKMSIHSAIIST